MSEGLFKGARGPHPELGERRGLVEEGPDVGGRHGAVRDYQGLLGACGAIQQAAGGARGVTGRRRAGA